MLIILEGMTFDMKLGRGGGRIMIKTVINNINHVNAWWVGFVELRLICMMYELWMMLDIKLCQYEGWETGIGRFGCVTVQEKFWRFLDMYAPPGGV